MNRGRCGVQTQCLGEKTQKLIIRHKPVSDDKEDMGDNGEDEECPIATIDECGFIEHEWNVALSEDECLKEVARCVTGGWPRENSRTSCGGTEHGAVSLSAPVKPDRRRRVSDSPGPRWWYGQAQGGRLGAVGGCSRAHSLGILSFVRWDSWAEKLVAAPLEE
ncbi:hypothetical protein NDU88_009940 [Pleurodeles waltl]|uniref:Uncharacterized protein n=1 Tax=Pleurodeles waltl TaxID=8319 RepID=A0AAV7PX87_PLEWA|nr:hypothetical protein NDU88_009940 [Pleurodeles waltl]